MGKRITKGQIVESLLAMDMDTYKKNKGALDKEDKVRIIDKEDTTVNETENIDIDETTTEESED